MRNDILIMNSDCKSVGGKLH